MAENRATPRRVDQKEPIVVVEQTTAVVVDSDDPTRASVGANPIFLRRQEKSRNRDVSREEKDW
jgi:hypothetical protein